MALVLSSGKRICSLEEDLFHLEPRVAKRCRFEALIEAAEDNSNATADEVAALAAAAVADCDTPGAASASGVVLSSNGGRRRLHADVDDDVVENEEERALLSSLSPAEKRVRRLMIEAASGSTSTARSSAKRSHSDSGGDACGSGDAASSGDETDVRSWSERVVRALHGCPSVEAALQRCGVVLDDLNAEVRQFLTREFEIAKQKAEAEAATDGGREQEAMNRVLRRTIQHLAKRCRKLHADGQENESLRQAVEQAQDEKRRLAHSNEVLQSHLRLQLDAVHTGPGNWAH